MTQSPKVLLLVNEDSYRQKRIIIIIICPTEKRMDGEYIASYKREKMKCIILMHNAVFYLYDSKTAGLHITYGGKNMIK